MGTATTNSPGMAALVPQEDKTVKTGTSKKGKTNAKRKSR